ncbi:biliverdin-producing heme oxygenase [Cellulomonas persica]|uniref:Biliverdin-producing heme oxygenase n=1 Tax=Cellulomonas persica TaxID=76861 RepID=A0A510USC2_9CELL|nr:biliverdin-producing heme oxygenase [Cellulomonas persica]GEK17564.1 biliverdin-producing heme oxygenase [Cellulomonas persica]
MTTTSVPTAPTTLSSCLREGTREQHSQAEGMEFIDGLVNGRLSREAYTALAVQQLAIYTALEAAGAQLRAAGADQGLVFDELTRVPAIESDLAFLLGADWAARVTFLPATQEYAQRLVACSSDLSLYAAHAYTRYLGDLSGGQVVKRMVQRHYGVPDEGVGFYDFPQIHKLKPFKDVYRERLDGLGLDDAQLAATVEEARVAFRLNQAVFAELGALHN